MKLPLSIPLLLLSIGVSAQGDAQKELEKLRGTWTLVSAAGHQLPPGTHAGLIITGDKYQGVTNGKVDEAGTIKLDVKTTPTSIDLLISEGTYAGKTQLGLVVAAGESLTLALAEPGATVRPTPETEQAGPREGKTNREGSRRVMGGRTRRGRQSPAAGRQAVERHRRSCHRHSQQRGPGERRAGDCRRGSSRIDGPARDPLRKGHVRRGAQGRAVDRHLESAAGERTTYSQAPG